MVVSVYSLKCAVPAVACGASEAERERERVSSEAVFIRDSHRAARDVAMAQQVRVEQCECVMCCGLVIPFPLAL